jgi:hypothetical protein
LGVGAVAALFAALLPGGAVVIGLPFLSALLLCRAVLIVPALFAALPATTLAAPFSCAPSAGSCLVTGWWWGWRQD